MHDQVGLGVSIKQFIYDDITQLLLELVFSETTAWSNTIYHLGLNWEGYYCSGCIVDMYNGPNFGSQYKSGCQLIFMPWMVWSIFSCSISFEAVFYPLVSVFTWLIINVTFTRVVINNSEECCTPHSSQDLVQYYFIWWYHLDDVMLGLW